MLIHLPREALRRLESLAVLGLFRSSGSVYLKEFLYNAKLAEIKFKLELVPTGFKLTVSGFTHKLPTFAGALGSQMAEFCLLSETARDFFRARFDVLRLDRIQEIDNLTRQEPYKQFNRICDFVTVPGKFALAAQISRLKALSLDEYLRTHRTLLARVYLETLISGNVAAAGAKRLEEAFVEPFKAKGLFGRMDVTEINDNRQIRLRKQHVVVYRRPLANEADPNSLFAMQFQMPQSLSFRYVNMLLGAYLENPFFEDLRSQQQVGYVVFAFGEFRRQTASLVFLIQSSSHSPADLSRRTREFIDKQRNRITWMSEADFKSLKQGALAKFRQEFPSIDKQHDFHWDEIQQHSYQFDRKRRVVEALEALRKKDLVDYFERVFFREQKVFEMHLLGASHRQEHTPPELASWQLGGEVLPVKVFEDNKKLQMTHQLNMDTSLKVGVLSV